MRSAKSYQRLLLVQKQAEDRARGDEKARRTHAHAYGDLSFKQKRAQDLARMREPAVRCPHCEMMVMPAELLEHLDKRCPGPAEPGPGAKWISHGEALALVPRETLSSWVKNQQVRFSGERRRRQYLHRDLVVKIAQHRGFRRR